MATLGIAASVIAVIQITTKVASLGFQYVSSVNRAPENLKALVVELKSLVTVLTMLQICAQDPESNTLRELDDPLRQCLAEMVKLHNKLELKNNVGWWGKARARLQWHFEEGEVLGCILRIERLKSLFTAAMNADQIPRTNIIKKHVQGIDTNTQGIGADVKGIEADIKSLKIESAAQSLGRREENTRQNDQKCIELLNWLYPEAFDTRHVEISGRRKRDTGQWILEAPEFKGWIEIKNLNSRLLWGYGIPGAGKTFLTSRVIDYLQDKAPTSSYGVAYIYFHFKEQEQQKPVYVLASLVKQLACQMQWQHLPKDIGDLHDKLEPQKKNPTLEDLYTILLAIIKLKSFVQTWVICDALDECDPKFQRRELLPLFHRMADDGINVFLTSREYPEDIQNSFQKSVKLKLWAKAEDIANYVQQKIDENSRAKRLVGQGGCKDSIITGLTDCAKGMFLLVHFHIEHLCQQPTVGKILKELERLQSSSTEERPLDPTYDRAMERLRV